MISHEQFRGEALRRDLESLERDIASHVRLYTQPNRHQWNLIENRLLRLVLEAATITPSEHFVPDGTSDLALNMLARSLANATRETEYATAYLAALAALASAAAGNFATAQVFARRAAAAQGAENAGPFQRWAVTLLSDRSIPLVGATPPAPLLRHAQALEEALRTGATEHFTSADTRFASDAPGLLQSLKGGDPLLLLLWRLVLRQLRELSTARILTDAGRLPGPYIRALAVESPLLFPTQVQAIRSSSILNPERNSLVILPTSTGKSLLGEMALVSCLSDDRPLGLYLAPYRALTDQIHQRMRGRLKHIGVDCEARRGGYLTSPGAFEPSRRIVVATPEALDGLLRSQPHLLGQIACCVFDEFHLVEQPVRGIRYEGLLGRLSAVTNQRPKIVALSPVVAPSAELSSWLNVRDGDIVHSGWRPTARRIALANMDGRVSYFSPGDRLNPNSNQATPFWTGQVHIPYPHLAPPRRPHASARAIFDAQAGENASSVAVDQHRRFGRPVLLLASSREQTRRLANHAASLLPETTSPQLRALSVELKSREPHLYSLQICLLRGVAFHNAALPGWVRDRLQELMAEEALKVVVATTTLAEGVDLPFRSVVMSDPRLWRFGTAWPLPTLLFRNIAGRCGRAGVFAEGDTLIVNNPGREPSGESAQGRLARYFGAYVAPPPTVLTSSLSLLPQADEEGRTEMGAAFEAQLLAYLAISRPEDDEGQRFASTLFVSRFPNHAAQAAVAGQAFVDSLLDAPAHRVLERNSPVSLTDFGQVVLGTGLSPRSGIALAQFLESFAEQPEPKKGQKIRNAHGIEYSSLISSLARALLSSDLPVPELRSGGFSVVGRWGRPVTQNNMELVLLAWLSGLSIPEIAYLCIRSKDARRLCSAWLRSEAPPTPALETWVEQVAQFLTGYVSQQWSWVLRGAAAIAGSLGRQAPPELGAFAERMEFGVRHVEAARWLREGCRVDRAKVSAFVDQYKRENPNAAVTFGGALSWVERRRSYFQSRPIGYFPMASWDAASLSDLEAFLTHQAQMEASQ